MKQPHKDDFVIPESQRRLLSKSKAIMAYARGARYSAEMHDMYEFRENLEHLLSVVSSEVSSYGGNVPKVPQMCTYGWIRVNRSIVVPVAVCEEHYPEVRRFADRCYLREMWT